MSNGKEKQMGSLIESIVSGRLEDALFQTCELLMEDNVIALENGWIAAVARIGDVEGINAVAWYGVCKDVWDACNVDGIRVKDALLTTGKLCMLSRQLAGSVGLGGMGFSSIASLRSRIIAFFPENGMRLTQRGVETFNRILPIQEDERAFAERLLIGLSQLWDDQRADLRIAMEYLLRKKTLVLHCASIGKQDMWPYPSLEESERGDLAWFLWGAWMSKYAWAEVLWRLFCLNFKRGVRQERLGLLIGCRGMLSVPSTNSGSIWGEVELTVFQYIEENAGAMWKEATAGNKKFEKTRAEKPRASAASAENIWNFVPRKGAGLREDDTRDARENDDAHSKSVGLKARERSRPKYDAITYPSSPRNWG